MTHFIIHYHLKSGGVTSVIKSERSTIPLAVLISSSQADINFSWLDYHSPQEISEHEMLEQFLACTASYPQPHIFHIHNPTLGCHPLFTEMIRLLALRGERIIMHIHDFPEDKRPNNLAKIKNRKSLYPIAAQIHYCVLTQRDADILAEAQIPETNIHIVPNPCDKISSKLHHHSSSPFVLIPCRAIPRKNIPEVLLLAAIAPPAVTFAITLPPKNPDHFPYYELIIELSHQLNLKITFAASESEEFSSLMTNATHLLSTSRQEGFGMIYLEAIAYHKPLIARDICHVTSDLAKNHIHHPHLYQKIHCPTLSGDQDFSTLSLAEQAALIKHAIRHPHDFIVTHHQQSSPLQEWIRDCLTNPYPPLSEELLSIYCSEKHAETIQHIIHSLQDCDISAIQYADQNHITWKFSQLS